MAISILIFYLFLSRLLLVILNKSLRKYFKMPMFDSAHYYYYYSFYINNKIGDIDYRSLLSLKPVTKPLWFCFFTAKILSPKLLYNYSFIPNLFLFLIGLIFLTVLSTYMGIEQNQLIFILILVALFPDNLIFRIYNINFLSFSPRYITVLINSFYWFIVINYELFSHNYLYFVLIFLGVIALQISFFSRQAFIFTNLIFFFFDTSNFVLFTISFALFFLLNPKEKIKIFLEQFKIMKWQFLRLKSQKLFHSTIKENIWIILTLLISIFFFEQYNLKSLHFFLTKLIFYIITSLSKF